MAFGSNNGGQHKESSYRPVLHRFSQAAGAIIIVLILMAAILYALALVVIALKFLGTVTR